MGRRKAEKKLGMRRPELGMKEIVRRVDEPGERNAERKRSRGEKLAGLIWAEEGEGFG